VISRFHDLALERSGAIMDTIQAETGKARRDALAEVLTLAGTIRYYLVHGGRFLRSQRRRGAIPVLTKSALEHKPHGVVAAAS
jgi:succinate-semialdehyde dehydrogenase / glutarate-semialdehyde dehydrogenase